MGRASKDKRDIYYRKAKEEGYRARSAYKLLQINEEYNILDKNKIRSGAVDLCAAPGSWSQVLSKHFQQVEEEERARHNNNDISSYVKPCIIAVDLQEMSPIEGVTLVQGDITSEKTSAHIIELLNQHYLKYNASRGTDEKRVTKADIVICDGAPDVTGMHELDEYLQHQLLLAALLITTCVLEEGGTFVTKMFRGPNTPFLIHKSEVFFDQVRVVKPRSSRNASMEAFLLCQGFRLPCGYIPRLHLSASSDRADPNTAAQLALQGASVYTPEAPAYRSKEEEATALAVEDHTIAPGASIRWVAPFVACGDLSGFDADMNYDRDPASVVLPPVQPPLQAPYLPQKGHTTTHSTASSANETPTKKKKV